MRSSKYSYLKPGWVKFEIVEAASASAPGSDGWNQPDNVVITVDLKALTGPDKGAMLQVKVFDNGQFVLGNIITACGIKLPSGPFALKTENLVGKLLWAQVEDRSGKVGTKSEGKTFSEITRWEKKDFVPPTAAAAMAETAAATMAPAAPKKSTVPEIEEISEADLS
jgi:hypothetical protein